MGKRKGNRILVAYNTTIFASVIFNLDNLYVRYAQNTYIYFNISKRYNFKVEIRGEGGKNVVCIQSFLRVNAL